MSQVNSMDDLVLAMSNLKYHLQINGIPYLNMGIATEKIVVRVKFKEYAEQVPKEMNGIPVVTSVTGHSRAEYQNG